MAISKNKKRYSITLMTSTYNIIDYVAKSTGKTRSEVIESLMTYCVAQIPDLPAMVDYVKNDTILD